MASIFKPAGKSKYVIFYHDEDGKRHKKTGATDKQVTERIARDIENRMALLREGIIDPKAEAYRDHAARPLADHLAAWIESLQAKGTTAKHSKLFSDRARRVVALVMGATLAEIEPGKPTKANIERAETALTKWVKAARLNHLAADRVQSALAALRAEGRSLATCNHHRAAIRALAKWLHETHRTRENTLRGVTGFNAKEDRRHDRRTLALDELRKLIDAAATGPDFQRMTGPARALCYRLAVASGLRYAELASLVPESFDFQNGPGVTVAAAYAKNGPRPPRCPCRMTWRKSWPRSLPRWPRALRSSPCPSRRARKCFAWTWPPPVSHTAMPPDWYSTSIRSVASAPRWPMPRVCRPEWFNG